MSDTGPLVSWFKLYLCIWHGLKMCLWFGYNPQIIFCRVFRILNLVSFQARILSNCIDSGYSSYSFMPIFWKLYRCFCHGLKMCMWFGYNPQINFCHVFRTLNTVIFQSWIQSKCIDTGQLLLQFYADRLGILHVVLSWSEDVHVVWI